MGRSDDVINGQMILSRFRFLMMDLCISVLEILDLEYCFSVIVNDLSF